MVLDSVRSWTTGGALLIVGALAVNANAAPPAAGPAPPAKPAPAAPTATASAAPAAGPNTPTAATSASAGTPTAGASSAPTAPAAPAATPAPTPPKDSPPVVAPAAATPPAAEKPAPTTSSTPGEEAPLKMLALTLGGGLAQTNDDHEGAAQRGSGFVELAFQPSGGARGLVIAAGYEDLLGSWDYVQKSSALDGSGPLHTADFEQRHRAYLDVRYDLLRLIKKGLPVHLSPQLGLGLVKVDSSVYNSFLFGGGGGGVLAVDVDPRTTLDLAFSVTRGFMASGGERSLYGGVTGLFDWGAGVSLGATDWSRIRLGYVGEALDREHTTRLTHGARLSFTVSFL